MNRHLVFTVLDSVLALLQSTVHNAPALEDDDDPDLVEDLLCLIAALHFAARRYRDAIASVHTDPSR